MSIYQVRYNGRTVATFTSLRFAQLKKVKVMRDEGCEEKKVQLVEILPSGREEVIG